jgi:hypothetical protein
VIDQQGKEVYPAKDSGVEIGDIILKKRQPSFQRSPGSSGNRPNMQGKQESCSRNQTQRKNWVENHSTGVLSGNIKIPDRSLYQGRSSGHRNFILYRSPERNFRSLGTCGKRYDTNDGLN